MAVWADVMIAAKNRNLIRKSLDAAVLIAPTSAAAPATIVNAATTTSTAGTELVIPTAFKHLGLHSDDGVQWARETETSDITSHGLTDPSRSDTRKITNTLTVTAQETNIVTMGAALSVTLVATLPASGEWTHDESPRPRSLYFRMLALSVDDSDFGEIYTGKFFPSAKVTEAAPGAWTDGDEAQSRALTIQGYNDPVLGTSVRHFAGGPGWRGLATAMGFTIGV